jgi:hypothetical protein
MPVHFNLTGGYLISGRLEGMCEMYTCDEKGNGEIYIGNFIRGKLNDPNGTYMTYSNVSYVSYKGAFVDNRMDGQIEVIRVEFPEQETEDEKKIKRQHKFQKKSYKIYCRVEFASARCRNSKSCNF